MNTERKHSPLPWEAEPPSLVLLDPYGNVVADCEVETFGTERIPNAELIALACNNHQRLVDALRRLVDICSVFCNLKQASAAIRVDVWGEMCAANNAARLVITEVEKMAQPCR